MSAPHFPAGHPPFLGGQERGKIQYASFFGDIPRLFPPQPKTIESSPLIAISDIRGNLKALERLWVTLSQNPAFTKATLVFLGNYVDEGPNSMEVLDWLVKLRNSRPETVFLAGEHDLAMALFLGVITPPKDKSFPGAPKDPPHPLYKGDGANTMHPMGLNWGSPADPYSSRATFDSYGADFGDRAALNAAVPLDHKEFLKDLPWIVEHPNYIFVSSGIDSEDVANKFAPLHDRDLTKSETIGALSGPANPVGSYDQKTIVSSHGKQADIVSSPTHINLRSKDKIHAVILPEGTLLNSD